MLNLSHTKKKLFGAILILVSNITMTFVSSNVVTLNHQFVMESNVNVVLIGASYAANWNTQNIDGLLL